MSFKFFQHFFRREKKNQSMGFPCSQRLCKVRWCARHLAVFVRWSHRAVFLKVSIPPPQLSPHYQELAEKRDTCPVYRPTDFAKGGLNKVTCFLALRREEAASNVANPPSSGLWTEGKGTFFRGGKLLFLPDSLLAAAGDSSD